MGRIAGTIPGLAVLLLYIACSSRAAAQLSFAPLFLDEGGQAPRQAESPGSTAPQIDKSQFNLFNPVPRNLLREMQTDRPDQTEGPYTVDAGHLQAEMDLANYTYDRQKPHGDPITTQTLTIVPTNFRVGLLNNLEFDLITFPFIWQRNVNRDTGTGDERDGWGDTTLRAKVNFFGNDSGNVALGLIPYLKIPTNQARLGNHYIEGGVILPVSLKLPDTWEIDAMTEVDIFRNAANDGYHPEWVNSIVLHRDLIPNRLNAYIEFYSSLSRDRHTGPYATADTGLLLAITEDIQLDCGINMGLTRRAPDYNPFVGLSVRF